MTSHPFGTGWRFGPAPAGSSRPEFDYSGFAWVTLPHTVVPLSWRDWDPSAWERVWMYRKRFDAPHGADGRRVFLDFAAAMTRATVTLNGAEVADHLGGYLPFSAEIGGLLRPRGNVLAVRLDSAFNLNVPPDRPAPQRSVSVDYWQPGGIYRDVRLRVVPPVFLADVFAKPVSVLDPAARQVVVQATVDGSSRPELRIDRYGGPRPYVAGQVTFDLTGPAVLVGDNPFDFAAAGGAAAVWIRSVPGARGTVTIRASHPSLGRAVARVRVRPAPRATGLRDRPARR